MSKKKYRIYAVYEGTTAKWYLTTNRLIDSEFSLDASRAALFANNFINMALQVLKANSKHYKHVTFFSEPVEDCATERFHVEHERNTDVQPASSKEWANNYPMTYSSDAVHPDFNQIEKGWQILRNVYEKMAETDAAENLWAAEAHEFWAGFHRKRVEALTKKD